MSRRSVYVSDQSGEVIPAGKEAKVRITFADRKRGAIELDVSEREALELGKGGRQRKLRGRQPAGNSH